MSLAILFHFSCAEHDSDINISNIRNLRLFCWITTLVVLFLVRCVLEIRCGWCGVVPTSCASACNTDTTPTQPRRNSNTHRTKNNKTNVVIQQNSRKLLMMDILMSEACSAHKKWNKIASDIKLVFYSSTITMMHGPINIRSMTDIWRWWWWPTLRKSKFDQNIRKIKALNTRCQVRLWWYLASVTESEPATSQRGQPNISSTPSEYFLLCQ